jgi:hypothetical protein
LFNALVDYYENKKINIGRDFITYVVGLASFGKSSYSRKFSVVFSSGFTNIIQEYNNELVERLFRSATDMEKSVRFAISQGFYYLGKYIKHNLTLLTKYLNNVSEVKLLISTSD